MPWRNSKVSFESRCNVEDHDSTAGPLSLEEKKMCTFGSKSGTKSLVRRYQARFAKNSSRAFERLSGL